MVSTGSLNFSSVNKEDTSHLQCPSAYSPTKLGLCPYYGKGDYIRTSNQGKDKIIIGFGGKGEVYVKFKWSSVLIGSTQTKGVGYKGVDIRALFL